MGKPFFPVRIFTYKLNSNVMAEIHDKQFNTIPNGFNPEQLNYIHEHGLKAGRDKDVKNKENHPQITQISQILYLSFLSA